METNQNCFEIWACMRRIFSSLGLMICFLQIIMTVDGARSPGSSGVDRECNGIGNIIKGRGFTYPWWKSPQLPSSSNSSGNCPIGRTGEKSTKCCPELESSLTQRNEMSAAFNDKWLGPKLVANAEIFQDRKKKFDVTFKDLLTRAHAAFHAMFERTYGMLYIQHATVFHALFQTLEAYYDTGRDSLEEKLNGFFAILTRKMFVVLNSQYEFDDAYLSCATIVISEKQGGDLHRQIVSSLRRSFVATRALAQGLNDAERVFMNLQKLKMSQDCLGSLSSMLQCPICSELKAYKPCIPYCTAITSQCLSVAFPLIKSWTEFANAMENILDRLLGPYNVEAVVEPIHIKISEAIMNFQESGPDLSQAVFGKCGKAKLKSARTRRDAGALIPENLRERPDKTNPSSDLFRATTGHEDTQPSKSLEKLLREIKNRVRKSKSMWDVLPRQVCNGISKDYSSQLCWNGTLAMRPERNASSDGTNGRLINSKGAPNILVMEQVIILQQITEKLRASFNGMDVQWVQENNDDLDFGGSGMGSGSGEMPTDLEDSDDDDPSGQIKPQTRIPVRQPPHPKFPARPPPILNLPPRNHEDDEDDDDEDNDNNSNWRITPGGNFNTNKNNDNRGGFGGNNDGIDFAPMPPKTSSRPPPPIFIPEVKITTTTTTSTTTRRPSAPIDVTKTKHPTSSSGSMDEAGKAIAFFKLFSPIFASMIGKAFSFT